MLRLRARRARAFDTGGGGGIGGGKEQETVQADQRTRSARAASMPAVAGARGGPGSAGSVGSSIAWPLPHGRGSQADKTEALVCKAALGTVDFLPIVTTEEEVFLLQGTLEEHLEGTATGNVHSEADGVNPATLPVLQTQLLRWLWQLCGNQCDVATWAARRASASPSPSCA